jgi:hypothetical protein
VLWSEAFVFPLDRAAEVAEAVKPLMSDATYNTTGLMMAACPPPAFQPALVVSAKLIGDYQRFFGWPFLLATWLAFGLGKLDCDARTENLKK